MGLDTRKPVFGVCDKVIFKQAYSATETSWKTEFSLVASIDIILSNKRIGSAVALVERLTRDRRAPGSSITGVTALCP